MTVRSDSSALLRLSSPLAAAAAAAPGFKSAGLILEEEEPSKVQQRLTCLEEPDPAAAEEEEEEANWSFTTACAALMFPCCTATLHAAFPTLIPPSHTQANKQRAGLIGTSSVFVSEMSLSLSMASSSRLFLLLLAALTTCSSAFAAAGSRHSRITLTAAAAATPPPPGPQPKPNATEIFLTAHNQARSAVGVGPLAWSPNLAAEASRLVRYQRDRKVCEFADLDSSPYGANQAWANYPVGPAEVVASWVEAKRYYDHTSNTCAKDQGCGTYTQVVWRKTTQLGCAQATCGKAGPTLTLCFYYPHGNVQGQSPY